MINKLNRLAAKLLGEPIELQNLEKDAICLNPSEVQEVRPAIYIESHLQRVLGSHHLSSVAYEFERLHQKIAVHAATKLYSIGKTKLFRGGLWTEKNQVLTRLLKEKDPIYSVNLESAVLTDSDIANQYFGHWISDAVPAQLVGTTDMPSLIFRKPHYQHASEYAHIFDLQNINGNMGVVENLYLLQDYSQNSYKVKRYLQLRQLLQKNLTSLIDSEHKGVFMARGNTGVKRSLINEDAVIEHLKTRGFDIVYPEKMTVSDLARRLWNVPLVISVEGSALNHCIYSMALHGAYLILQPPNLVNHVHKGICDAMNRFYGFYVCQAAQNSDEFYVDSMPDLDRVIDGLLNAIEKNR